MKIWKLSFVFCLMAALFFMAYPAAAADSLKIVGSTTVYPVAEAAVKAYKMSHPDARIDLSAGGSSVGVRAIIDGMAEIGDSSRDMSDKELDLAKKKGLEVQKHVVAFDCIVPIVHPSNPVASLTIQQLKDIYTGKIANWKEVGGPDEKIVVVSREDTSGTYETWQHFVLGKDLLAPKVLKQQSNPGVRAYVAKSPKAIGYVGFGFAKDPSIKGVKVNGMPASPEAAIKYIQSKGREGYPISRELYMFTAGEFKGIKKDFIDFVMGPKGQELVEREGFIRVK